MTHQIRDTIVSEAVDLIAAKYSVNTDRAFLLYCYSNLFDIDIEDIPEEDLIDSSQDKQIDIIHIEDDDDETGSTVHIIQCKNSDGFSSDSFIKFKNGLEWIFSKPKSEYERLGNIRLVSKIREIREMQQNSTPANITLKLYFITRGDKSKISPEFKQEENGLTKEFNFFRSADLYIWGSVDLVSLIGEKESERKAINQKILIQYDVNFPSLLENMNGNYRGVICTVKAKEIARLIKEDSEKFIFNKNIRRYLGQRKKVNQGILKSSTDEAESKLFWFLNNGITMTCDKYSIVRDPDKALIDVTNLQIVNGCQTSMTLFSADESGDLSENASVLVKLFQTGKDDPSFVDKITLTTNNQNKISIRDLRANDSAQVDLQNAFRSKYGLLYERKVNEFKNDRSGKRIINNEKLAQAFVSFAQKKPSMAWSKRAKLWSDEYYDTIFRKNSVERLYYCYLLYHYCLETKRSKMEQYKVDENLYSIVANGIYHIVRVMGRLNLGSEQFPENTELSKRINAIVENKDLLRDQYDRSISILNNILKENEGKYTSPNNFFKKTEIQGLINEKLSTIK